MSQANRFWAKGFWNWRADAYAKSPVADEKSYRKKIQLTQERLKPDMDVLEFGCGTGTTALLHSPLVHHILAIDTSINMQEIAKAKAEKENITNVTFENAAIEDLDVSENKYHVVMGHSILHLLKNKEAAIEKSYQILKPGGMFITSTACLGGTNVLLQGVLKFVLAIGSTLGLLPAVNFFTVDDLVKSITHAGFEIKHQWQPGKDKAVFIIATKPSP